MALTEISDIADIQRLTVAGFSDWKQMGEVNVATNGDLLLFNYNNKAQYEGRWNYFERESRGLIINKFTGEVVARPFSKFFNWLEGGRRSSLSSHIVTVTEKIDGSLCILFRNNGCYQIATRGAFFSPQAVWATEFLNENYNLDGLPEELTLILEGIAPQFRVIVDYQKEDLVLLAARNRFTGEYLPFFPNVYELAERYGFSTPKVYAFNKITDIIENLLYLPANQEGYVVEFSDRSRFKFKGEQYRELHKLVSSLSFKHTLEAMANGKVNEIRSRVPEEFLGEFEGWVREIETTVAVVKEAVGVVFDIAPKETRKEFAGYVMTMHKALFPYLFAMLDGKEIEPLIYKHAFKEQDGR